MELLRGFKPLTEVERAIAAAKHKQVKAELDGKEDDHAHLRYESSFYEAMANEQPMTATQKYKRYAARRRAKQKLR